MATYRAAWRAWLVYRQQQGKPPRLTAADGEQEHVNQLVGFLALCAARGNTAATARRKLAAVRHWHLHPPAALCAAGVAPLLLPTAHPLVGACARGLARAPISVHSANTRRALGGRARRRPLTRDLVDEICTHPVSREVAARAPGRMVVIYGLALSFFALARTGELWAEGRWTAEPNVLTRGDITWFCEEHTLAWWQWRGADAAILTFGRTKTDQLGQGDQVAVRGRGLEVLKGLFSLHLALPDCAPLTAYEGGAQVTRREAAGTFRSILKALEVEGDLMRYTLYSGRVGGATHLLNAGASEAVIKRAGRWRSDAYMAYLRTQPERDVAAWYMDQR